MKTNLTFFGPMRPEKIIFEKGEFLYQNEAGQVLWTGGSKVW